MEDLTGKQLGPYKIEGPLGEGGMAAVYRAYQANMDRHVALKILPRHFASDPEFTARFDQEARIIGKLQHVHILPVHDYGQAEGYTYIVMPFISTGTLADLLRESGQMGFERVASIIGQVGEALGYAHSRGVIHRDVKPSNILVDDQGNCRLTDFGIAKMVEGTLHLTQTGAMAGTPAYMSPEQIQGETLDGRSDLYSLAIVLFEMVTGRQPYRADTPAAVLVKHLHDPPPSPRSIVPDLPAEIERVIVKALAKARDQRYSNAAEFVKEVRTALLAPRVLPPATSSAELSKTLAAEPGLASPRRFPWLLVAGGASLLALLGVVAVGGLLLAGAPKSPTPTAEPSSTDEAVAGAATSTLEPALAQFHVAWSDSAYPLLPRDGRFSPDGKTIALALAGQVEGGSDPGVRLYSAADLSSPALEFNSSTPTIAIGWSADGSRLWSIAAAGQAGVWQVDLAARTANNVWVGPLAPEVLTDTGRMLGAQPLLAAMSGGGSIVVHGPARGDWADGWPGHSSPLNAFGWISDGVRTASASDDSILVWEAGRGRSLLVPGGTLPRANALDWSPDGSRIASAGNDGAITIWLAATRQPLAVLPLGEGRIHCVAWSPDGRWLAAGTVTGAVVVLDAQTSVPIITFREEAAVVSVSWSPDGSMLLASTASKSETVGGRLHLWRLP